eukprot:g5178.t1
MEASSRSAADAEKRERQLTLVLSHVTINIAVSLLNFTTRGEILRRVLGKRGDYSVVGKWMSYWTGLTALVEFALNPTVGKLSDTYGRKPFMVLSPYAALILKSWVLLRPSLLSLTVERVVCDGLRTLSGTTMGSAAITDLVEPSQLGKANARMFSYIGIAIFGAPLAASVMSARASYMAAIGLAGVQLYTDSVLLQETLPEAQRKPYTGYSNPLELFRMFGLDVGGDKGGGGAERKSLGDSDGSGSDAPARAAAAQDNATIATLVMTAHNFIDLKIMADPMITLQLSALEWTRAQTQRFTSLLGMGLVVGRQITARTIDRLGVHGHTTFTHVVTIVSDLLLGLLPSSFTMLVHGVLGGWVGSQRTHCVKQLSTNLCLATGRFGKGELSGLQANLRALCVSIGPFAYATLASWGFKNKRPGLAFLLSASFCVVAEWLHQRLQAGLALKSRLAAEDKPHPNTPARS